MASSKEQDGGKPVSDSSVGGPLGGGLIALGMRSNWGLCQFPEASPCHQQLPQAGQLTLISSPKTALKQKHDSLLGGNTKIITQLTYMDKVWNGPREGKEGGSLWWLHLWSDTNLMHIKNREVGGAGTWTFPTCGLQHWGSPESKQSWS